MMRLFELSSSVLIILLLAQIAVLISCGPRRYEEMAIAERLDLRRQELAYDECARLASEYLSQRRPMNGAEVVRLSKVVVSMQSLANTRSEREFAMLVSIRAMDHLASYDMNIARRSTWAALGLESIEALRLDQPIKGYSEQVFTLERSLIETARRLIAAD
ncbi:MAG: hypothetical protein ACF8SC_06855 [Phycisphaerales bacterium JB037]